MFILVCFHQLQSAGVGVGLEREQLEPQFLIKGQKITAKLGDTVVLPCKVANLGELAVLLIFMTLSCWIAICHVQHSLIHSSPPAGVNLLTVPRRLCW